MATYFAKDLAKLANEIKDKHKVADSAASLAINKTVTFAIREAINEIQEQVTLKESYIKKHLKRGKRAKPTDLRSSIRANERATLMHRFQHSVGSDGIRVKVNTQGGTRHIKSAKMMRLRNQSFRAIGVHNIVIVKELLDSFDSPKKRGKLIRKARNKPYGMTPLHSRSINQLFRSVREDIQPEVIDFLVNEFLNDFNRLKRK